MKLFILDYENKRTKIGKGMARKELKMMNKKPDLYTIIVSYFSIFSLFFLERYISLFGFRSTVPQMQLKNGNNTEREMQERGKRTVPDFLMISAKFPQFLG
ncbi:CEI_1a_G0032150.mRNA.1.CDS.1 [Saccharomyces cerevisiae]|nr:CEI_1a_G0032150.mRNA.1.CDS.1 [Saccharomyces cerevisiae]CAI7379467.1 CEI_1a_G0032150.mRNA.1.CDS.1 [Saccharomyces cerevisiae]